MGEGILVKLREWQSQHFSQLQKLGRSRGLNWQTTHLERPVDGRSLEDVQKSWILDRLVTYELHAEELRRRETEAVTLVRSPTPALNLSAAVSALSGNSQYELSRTASRATMGASAGMPNGV